MEYKDFQSATGVVRIKNADIQSGRIANPPERKFFLTRIAMN
jgi:hypothetical protein